VTRNGPSRTSRTGTHITVVSSTIRIKASWQLPTARHRGLQPVLAEDARRDALPTRRRPAAEQHSAVMRASSWPWLTMKNTPRAQMPAHAREQPRRSQQRQRQRVPRRPRTGRARRGIQSSLCSSPRTARARISPGNDCATRLFSRPRRAARQAARGPGIRGKHRATSALAPRRPTRSDASMTVRAESRNTCSKCYALAAMASMARAARA
jgi:hypothetical protein